MNIFIKHGSMAISGRCNGTDIEFPTEMSVELSTELIEGNAILCKHLYSMHAYRTISYAYGKGAYLITGVHERPHIYTLMQTHINPEMTAIRPIPLLLPHHHKSVPGEKPVGNQP